MLNYLSEDIPCGSSLPVGNPHAVSVCLPTIDDVIGYEEGLERVKQSMQSGYPRFFTNKFVEDLVKYIRNKHDVPAEKVILPINSGCAKEILERLVEVNLQSIDAADCCFLVFNSDDEFVKKCRDYIRNCGLLISSRKAESALQKLDLIQSKFSELKYEGSNPEEIIKKALALAYNVGSENVLLTSSGMNALYAAYEAGLKFAKSNVKKTVVQLGWLYLDTMEIIEKRSGTVHVQIDVHDKDQLESWLKENHVHTALLVTEAVTNPLLHCVDLPWLYALCQKYEIVMVVDTTLVTPFNAILTPYCDIAIESLTKFASGGGDVMMGAIIFNPESTYFQKAIMYSESNLITPFEGELRRLAFQIEEYEVRVRKVSVNTSLLFSYLQKQPYISKIQSLYSHENAAPFSKIRKSADAIPGLITVEFDKDLRTYYDHLMLPKGPSFGTEFTIAMPYVYLAHYDDLQTEDGRTRLKVLGINPELLRISVGTESVNDIIAVFEKLNSI